MSFMKLELDDEPSIEHIFIYICIYIFLLVIAYTIRVYDVSAHVIIELASQHYA